jgi:hypothetical protein
VNLLIGSTSVDRPAVSLVALAGLAYLAPDRTLDWLESFHSNLPTPGYGALRHWTQHAIVSLSPELTLPLARTRLFDQRPHERMLAEDLLATHATVEDIPALRSAIKEALEDDCASCYRLCDLLHAFEHLPPGTGPVPELTDAFSRFRYSRGRGYATRAIQSTAPELFCETFAFECLASSPWEDSQVRELASQRVTSA